MKNEQEDHKIQNENIKTYSRNGGYFYVNISNSLELLERYRVSIDSSVTVY